MQFFVYVILINVLSHMFVSILLSNNLNVCMLYDSEEQINVNATTAVGICPFVTISPFVYLINDYTVVFY